MTLTQEAIRDAVCEVLPQYDILEAYLFGSYARGDNTEQSDVDLRFLCGDDLTLLESG